MSNGSVFYEGRGDEQPGYGGEYSPLQPDEVLAYHFESIRRKTELEPEQNLMLAVLEDAIECFQKHVVAKTGKARTIFQESEDWIFEDTEKRIFSFNTICEHLDIDPHWLRQRLMNWKQRQIEEGSRYRPAA